MDISIILSTYRREEILKKTLESFVGLDTKGITWEILVIDNAVDKKTESIVSTFLNELPVRYFTEIKRGKCSAINRHIEKANGKWLVFTDDDILADKNWLQEIVSGVSRWPNNKVFGGRILPYWPNGKRPPRGIDERFLKCAFVIADWDQSEGPFPAGNVWGPNMIIHREIFKQGWRFNETIGTKGNNYIIGEETDLTRRLEEAGYIAVYLPKVLVYHQIRHEQLKLRWIYRRSFIHGRAEAFEEKDVFNNVPKIGNVPRFLIKLACGLLIQRLIANLRGDSEEQVNLGIRYWFLRGKIYQYWRQQVS